ncbi:hypothetical protein HDF26_003543 [Pedobacter cryoconitis]|uniref:hypothetical protein n=1 Tax=Pedobacter cryoconitis TaxID=188932 RepID=UPI00161C97E8|nr:hypothetical protein [Pedobacter cryoconitis]MBB6273083.1 hypothetical protein [Pedobacter cryoconitis]
MKISKELIEKYHLGECSPKECETVENWLFSEETDLELQLPATENKEEHKAQMWAEIQTIFPLEAQKTTPQDQKTIPAHKIQKLKPEYTITWKKVIAASLILGFISFISYRVYFNPAAPLEFVSVNNNSLMDVRHIESAAYCIALAPESTAKINYQTGIIDFSGSILISPKEDIELNIGGNGGKVIFKTGQTYIAMNGKSQHDQFILINERNLMDLPPVLQKQIISKFKI